MDLSNRVAIITGSSQGRGRAIALKLAEVGAAIVINDIEIHGMFHQHMHKPDMLIPAS